MRLNPIAREFCLGENYPYAGSGCSQNIESTPPPRAPNFDSNPNATTAKEWGPLVTYPLKTAKCLFNVLIYGILLGITAGYTPGMQKAINSAAQTNEIGLVPRPSNERNINKNKYGYPFDNFFQHFDGFEDVVAAIKEANIDPLTLDKNNTGRILDTQEEIYELISKLEEAKLISPGIKRETYNNAIKLLQDINILSRRIWGADPNPDVLSQAGEPNCQGMAVFRGMLLTPDGIQESKGLIRVTNYSLDQNNFFIDFMVGNIPVSWKELVNSMSPKWYTPSHSTDNTLYTTLMNTALKKGLTDVIPNVIPSSSPILITNKNYSTFLFTTFSNNELDEILSNAPGTLITVASKFDLDDVINGIEFRSMNIKEPEISDIKAHEFKKSIVKLVQEDRGLGSTAPTTPIVASNIQTNLSKETPTRLVTPTFPLSAPLDEKKESQAVEKTAKDVITGHVYVAENYDRLKGILTISDTHGTKIRLTREEAREHLIAFIAPNESIDFFSNKSYLSGIALGLGLTYFFRKKLIKLMFVPKV